MLGRDQPVGPATGPSARRLPRMLALAAACGAAFPALAATPEETAPAVRSSPAQSLGVVIDQLLREGKFADAEDLLNQVLKADPQNRQARFLSGMVAMARGDTKRAIRVFRAMLIDHPEAVRVRLELGRAFFLDKDYANADRQFRFARAGNHPREVIVNIDDYLYAIRQSKDWSYSISVALAPDTNLNAGASAREVSLFGLPFELSDDARQRSGMGIAAEAAAEFAPRIGQRTRLRMGINGQRREYSGTTFDDMTVAAYAGPRFVTPRWDVSVLASGFTRWFGTDRLMSSAGGRIEATYYVAPQLGLSGSLSAQWIDYIQASERNGPLYSANLGVIHPLGPTSAVSLKGGANRQNARSAAQSSWSAYGAVGYFRDLPAGFSVYLEPSLGFSRYDQALPAFGKPRSDRSVSAQVSVLNRHIVLTRFTPRVSYTFTRQTSNIPLYNFTRNRIEIGLTTSF